MKKPKVFQRKYTKPLPTGAKILRRRGGKYAQFTSRERVQEAKLTAEGDRILCASKNWFITFEDVNQIKHTVKAFPSEDATRVLAGKVKQLLGYRIIGEEPDVALLAWFADRPEDIRVQLVDAGLLDQHVDQDEGCLLLDDLVCEFERHLADEKERCSDYVQAKTNLLYRIVHDCGFTTWNDIDVDKAKQWLLNQRAGGSGCSKRTYNWFVQAVKQFTSYIVNERELVAVDPLRKLKRLPKQDTDIRHPDASLPRKSYSKSWRLPRKAQNVKGWTDRRGPYCFGSWQARACGATRPDPW